MTTAELAYAAGIIDGEGHITMPGHRVALGVGVNNTDERLIEWLNERWPGRLYTYPPNGNRQALYCWTLRRDGSIEFLRAILPYLVIKRETAEAALWCYV